MKPELLCLLLTAILTGLLWIPVVIGYVTARGPLKPTDYVSAPTSPLPDWVNRANRAHLNAVENFGPFAAVILIAQVSNITAPSIPTAAAVYFFSRLLHAIFHLTGFKRFRARTVVFTVGWMAFMWIAIVLLRHAF